VNWYKQTIDGCTLNVNSPDCHKISIYITQRIYKRSKLNLELTEEWWLIFTKLLVFRGQDQTINWNPKYVNALYNETVELDLSKKSSLELSELYALLVVYGLHKIAYIFRANCSINVITENQNNKSDLVKIERALAASFELFDWDTIDKVLQNIYPFYEDKIDIYFLYSFIKKVHPSFSANNLLFNTEDFLDKDFLSLVKGKTVAIVGPAISEQKNGHEIDSFDIVIRFNYIGEDVGLSMHVGSRIDIAYYNGTAADTLINENAKELPEGLKAAVFKTPVIDSFTGSKIIRQLTLLDRYFMLDCSATAIPNSLADLLLYSPLKIKIFSIDMFTTIKNRNSYTINERGRRGNTIFLEHDPFSQYKFIKNLYDNGFIDGDEIFQNIMNLGVQKYMELLQKIYLSDGLTTTHI